MKELIETAAGRWQVSQAARGICWMTTIISKEAHLLFHVQISFLGILSNEKKIWRFIL